MREILGFMEQSNISKKNIARLKALDAIDDATFQKLRLLILEIAQMAPRRRRRWKLVAANRRDLLQSAIEAGLIEDLREPGEFEEPDESEDPDPYSLAELRDPDDFDSFDMLFVSKHSYDSDDEQADSDIPF